MVRLPPSPAETLPPLGAEAKRDLVDISSRGELERWADGGYAREPPMSSAPGD
jgi:hypothetical protein